MIVLHDVSPNSSWLDIAPVFFEAYRLCEVDVLTLYVSDARNWPLPYIYEQAVLKLIEFFKISKFRFLGFGNGVSILLNVILRLPKFLLRKSYSGISIFVNAKNVPIFHFEPYVQLCFIYTHTEYILLGREIQQYQIDTECLNDRLISLIDADSLIQVSHSDVSAVDLLLLSISPYISFLSFPLDEPFVWNEETPTACGSSASEFVRGKRND